jgi:Heavy metal associated domain 2
MMTAYATQVAHFLPGRLRVKSEKVKHNLPLAREIEHTLTGLHSIWRVEANPLTGSVLVLYDPRAPESLSALMTCAEFLGLSVPERDLEHLENWLCAAVNGAPPGASASLGTGIQKMFESLNASAAQATGGWGDLRSLVPLTLFFLGVRSLLTADKLALPNWYDFFWFAFSMFVVLHPPGAPAE